MYVYKSEISTFFRWISVLLASKKESTSDLKIAEKENAFWKGLDVKYEEMK